MAASQMHAASIAYNFDDEETTWVENCVDTFIPRKSGESEPPTPDGTGLPPNFAEVLPGLYRSSYPTAAHFNKLEEFAFRTIVTLVGQQYPAENLAWIERYGIKHHQIPLPAHKEAGVVIPKEDMLKVLLILLDPKNYPVLVHCNKGKHRTGCTIACLRKVNGWSHSEVLEEYRFYSAPKSRSLDEVFFSGFDCTEIKLVAQKAGFIPMLPSPPYSQPSSLRRVSTTERTPENQTAVSNANSFSASSGTTGTTVSLSGPTPEEVAAVGKKLQNLSVD